VAQQAPCQLRADIAQTDKSNLHANSPALN
jgi:hypothetical protein